MSLGADRYEEFLELFRTLLHELNSRPPSDPGPLRTMVEQRLGVDPTQLPIVSDSYSPLEHPNLQLAVDDLIAAPDITAQLYGILGGNRRFMGIALRDIFSGMGGGRLAIGPIEYESRPVGVERSLSCVTLGLYLLSSPEGPAAILIHGDAERGPRSPDVIVDVIAATAGQAEALLSDLRRRARELNVYRRQMFSLGQGANPFGQNSLGVTFHPRPTVGRGDIVLPTEVLDRVERHILDIGRSSELLLRAGRHLKRGLLLHGPPGVGKTLTVRYLATEMHDATVIVLSGAGIGAIATSCSMARELAPSIVVVEDVDLIAQDRSMPGQHGQPLLFQLMNEIEGIADDADVAFILTTNRAEVLEPALAARPGRVDLAIGLERPDASARQQLIDLYGRGLELDVDDWAGFISRTDGVTPAFIKEWLRSAVLRADDPGRIREQDLAAALDELLGEANALTRVLLGGAAERAAAAGVRLPAPDRLPSHLGWMPGAASARREIANE